MSFEEVIAKLNPEQQDRAYRALNDEGARMFMGPPGVMAKGEPDYIKDHHYLEMLAKLSENDFQSVLEVLNQAKNHQKLFAIINSYSFYWIDSLPSFNVSKAIDFLNSDKLTNYIDDYYDISALIKFPLSKVEELASHPNITKLVDDRGAYYLTNILELSKQEFNNILKILDSSAILNLFSGESVYAINLAKVIGASSNSFFKMEALLNSNPDFKFDCIFKATEKLGFIFNLSSDDFNRFAEFLGNPNRHNFFLKQPRGELNKQFQPILKLDDNEWKNTLKALAIKEFSSFIGIDKNKLKFITDSLGEHNSTDMEFTKEQLQHNLNERGAKALQILKFEGTKKFIEGRNYEKQFNLLLELSFQQLDKAIKALEIKEMGCFIKTDKAELEFISNLSDEKFSLALEIIQKPGVLDYIGYRDRTDKFKGLVEFTNERLTKALNLLELEQFRSFIGTDKSKLEFISNLTYNVTLNKIDRDAVNAYQTIENINQICDFNEQLIKLKKIISVESGKKFLSGYFWQDDFKNLLNLSDDKFNLALDVLQKPGVIDYIGSWSSKLENLIEFPSDKLTKALKVLQIKAFSSFIIYSKESKEKLEFISNLSDSKINLALELLNNPVVINNYIMISGRYLYGALEQLESLLNLTDEQLSVALKVLENQDINKFIYYDRDKLLFMSKSSQEQLEKYSKILSSKEFSAFISQDKAALEFISNLSDDQSNLALETLKKSGVIEYIGNQDRSDKLNHLMNLPIEKYSKILSSKEFAAFIRQDKAALEFISNLSDDKLNLALETLKKSGVIEYIGYEDKFNKLNNLMNLPKKQYDAAIKILKHPGVVNKLSRESKNLLVLKYLINLPEKKYSEAIAIMRNEFCVAPKNMANNLEIDHTAKEASDWLITYAKEHKSNKDSSQFSGYILLNGVNDEQAVKEHLADNIHKLKDSKSCDSKALKNNKLEKVIKEAGADHAFQLPFAIAALANLDNTGNVNFYDQSSVYYYNQDNKLSSVAGVYSNGSVSVAVKYKAENQIKSTLVHELEHQAMSLVFNNGANPYGEDNLQRKQEFQNIILKTITKLHNYFLPGIYAPKEIDKMLENLKEVKIDNKIEQNIIDTFTALIAEDSSYEPEDYHAEFAARFPDILAENGELTPSLREIFQDLELDFKEYITPALREYVSGHAKKNTLIMNDDYSETALTHSSEYDLLNAKNPTESQLKLLKQFNEMKKIIAVGNRSVFFEKFKEISNETLKKAVLTEAIIHGNDLMSLTALFSINSKEFLGPQLIMATKLDKADVASELLSFIKNPYYLAKAAEVAACQDNQALSQKAIAAVNNEWFSARAVEYGKQAEEASVKFALCMNFEYQEQVNGVCEVSEHYY